jgi:hypothetical protein
VYDPYVYDYTLHRNLHIYNYDQNGQLMKFTTGNIALNASIGSDAIKAMAKANKPPSLTNAAEKNSEKTVTTAADPIPWNLSVYYNLGFDKITTEKLKLVQSLNFNGDINVTKNWKLGVTTGYDFLSKKLTYTSVNLYRDLKCWEAYITWIPFGFQKSYSITVNLKTSMLSDIKIPRQRQWFDNL